jgi:hypothetical protein
MNPSRSRPTKRATLTGPAPWRSPTTVRPTQRRFKPVFVSKRNFRSARRRAKVRSSSKYLLAALILVSAVLIFVNNRGSNNPPLAQNQPQPSTNNQASSQSTSAQNTTPISTESGFDFVAFGDMIPHETVVSSAKEPGGGYNFQKLIAGGLKSSFQKAPLRFCNHEATSSPAIGVRGYPAFNAPTQFTKDLASFGCNIFSVGNNHINDYSQAGIDATLEQIQATNPLAVSGANSSDSQQQKLQITTYAGIKVGFTSFNQESNNPPQNEYSINMLSNSRLLESQLKSLRQQSDVVIVSVHWGREDSATPTELQKKYAQQIADLGADIIIGTGPHVWQPYQNLTRADGKTSHVWYSIGNGLNSQTSADQLFSAMAIMHIAKDSSGKVQITNPRILPTYVHYSWAVPGILSSRSALSWGTLSESANLISSRNDFITSADEQLTKLKTTLGPDVTSLQSY